MYRKIKQKKIIQQKKKVQKQKYFIIVVINLVFIKSPKLNYKNNKKQKTVTDSSFKTNQKNISELRRGGSPQEKKFKINSSSSPTNNNPNKINKINMKINKNMNIPHKKYPLKTINISELKLFEENREINYTFLNHTNTNFSTSNNKAKSKNIFKINDIKLIVQNNNLNLKIKNN